MWLAQYLRICSGECTVLLGHMFKEHDRLNFPVSGVFLPLLGHTWNEQDSVVFPVLYLPSLLGHTLNEQNNLEFLCLSLSLLWSPWSEVSVAQHILISPDVHSIRTEDIFALEELSFQRNASRINSHLRRCTSPVESVSLLHLVESANFIRGAARSNLVNQWNFPAYQNNAALCLHRTYHHPDFSTCPACSSV